MPDDVLRLRATVVSEEALANIRRIGREIGMIPQQAGRGIAQVNTQFATLGATIKNVGRELSQAIPALGGFGLGAAGVGLAAGAMIRNMTEAAKRVTELKYASQELRMGTTEIRGWGLAAERVGISAQTMMQNMKNFSSIADGLKYDLGGVRSRLYELGAGPVVRSIQAATTQGDKLKEVFKFKDTLLTEPNGILKATEWMKLWGFGAESLRLTAEQAAAAMTQIKPRTKEAEEAAQRYQVQLAGLKETWDELTIRAGVLAFPGLTEGLGEITKTIEALDKLLARLPKLPKAGDFGTRIMPTPEGVVPVTPGGARPWWETPWRLIQPPAPEGAAPALPAGKPKTGSMLPDWLTSGAGSAASALWGGISKPWVAAHDVAAGRYDVQPETPGMLTEEDVERQRMAREQEIKDAFGMSGYGVQAWGAGGGHARQAIKNLLPENTPGAIDKAGSAAPPAATLPTVQEMNAARAARRGFKPISFGPEGGLGEPASGDPKDTIKRGVLEALIDFQSYMAGGGPGGGIMRASLGGGGGGGDNTPIGRAFAAAAGGGTGGAGTGTLPGGPSTRTGGLPGGPRAAPGGVPGGAPGGLPGGSVTPGAPGSTGAGGPGGAGGITAPAGTPVARQGLATVTTPGGKHFQVDARYAENFKGFLADYEAAGGVLGPNTGTLGTRPRNASGHPIGAAIDINQTARDVRKGGVTLPKELENALAEKWGLVSGANWRSPDAGHFGIRSSQAAAAALIRQGKVPAGVLAPSGQAGGTKGTWFNAGAAIGRWDDPAGRREGAQASGLPSTVPGIATPGREGLGEWYRVTMPDGRVAVVRKTDVGPGKGAQGRGVGVDVNAALASQMYADPSAFPSGQGGFRVERIGGNLPQGVRPGVQTSRIDAANAPQNINGQVSVNLYSNGTKATSSVKHRGNLFQKGMVRQHRQMQPTSDPLLEGTEAD